MLEKCNVCAVAVAVVVAEAANELKFMVLSQFVQRLLMVNACWTHKLVRSLTRSAYELLLCCAAPSVASSHQPAASFFVLRARVEN